MAAETKHTPGPWKWDIFGDDIVVLAALPNYKFGPNAVRVLFLSDLGTKADAQLMAAAPDLLASCKDLLQIIERHDDRKPSHEGRFTKALRAAIAKSEG